MRKVPLLLLPMLLAGCTVAVEYGDIPHNVLAENPRCNPAQNDSASVGGKDYFIVTSRLPDCRGDTIKLTNHRADRVRFGRFSPPETIKPAKGDKQLVVPLAFQPEDAWWDGLRDAANLRKGRVLLYVHGYRETLQTTARDTVQIGAMSNFDGPIIHYSWPSQGNLLSYAVDETNMYWDERNFRTFLTKLARAEWVKEIVIVSHSLGARLVTPAVEYVDRTSTNADSSNISNIILAAPDVDREDFERDIAEEVLAARRVNNDRRVTVYASLSDRALAVSRAVHGYPRLGSPYCFSPFEAKDLKAKGLPQRCFATKTKYQTEPAKTGFTIIDTTDLSGGGAGHSDYLRSLAVCKDFAAVVNGARTTDDRVATAQAHVFTLRAPVKPTKADIAAVCKRVAD
ncbi:esterase/lipase superfamily enzyme [Sphingorhabdus rigui]|uniref:Esterase/lipase superfamily enzyme n=1 Tax=Sphingorhabdus rigui TaxID=1282858 RepID=A0A840B1T9_9SPHN|nr:alpha/beta hydrolase [Sphingorhabdus rigui]MBB3942534.1 esterase/lipase superfamily enzyme [Sphingorhabdus rigui]